MAGTHTYRYVAESELATHGGLALATAGGRTEHPHFFRGFVERADQAAKALLAVAEVARTRYFDAGAATRMRDPVVTSNVFVLRFEAFSACNGVYARFDLDESGFDSEYVDWGTTNVDVNDALRASLAGISRSDPMRVAVGADQMVVETMDGAITERKVPLPERWLRGFAEAQIASSQMTEIADLPVARARAVLRDLPGQRTGNRPMWLVPSASGIRLSQRAGASGVSLVGPQRLAAFRRLLPFVERLTVYAPPAQKRAAMAGRSTDSDALVPSAWVAHLAHGRFTIVVSPELYRGFSGEGAVLEALAASEAGLADDLSASLAGQARLDIGAIAAEHDASSGDVSSALQVLGAAGRIGHDVTSAGFFHRDLPYDRASLDEMQPRAKAAAALRAAGAVAVVDEHHANVASDETIYSVRTAGEATTCTCLWFAKHRGERGPCKHVIAAQLAWRAAGTRT